LEIFHSHPSNFPSRHNLLPPLPFSQPPDYFTHARAGSSSSLWQRAGSSAPPLLPWPSSSCPWRPLPFSSSLLSTAISREQDQQPWRPENLAAELPRPAIVPLGEQQSRPPPALRPTVASSHIPSSLHGRAQWRRAPAIPSAPSSSMDCSSSTLLSMARASFFRAAEAPPHGAPTPCYIFSQPPLTLPRQPAQGPSSPWRPSPLLPALDAPAESVLLPRRAEVFFSPWLRARVSPMDAPCCSLRLALSIQRAPFSSMENQQRAPFLAVRRGARRLFGNMRSKLRAAAARRVFAVLRSPIRDAVETRGEKPPLPLLLLYFYFWSQ
jgi:hypothetical protein